MNQEEEKGFLSDKFDDWSSEPIPNGWGKIESILQEDDKKILPIWSWILPFIFTCIGGISYQVFKISESNLIVKNLSVDGLKNSLSPISDNNTINFAKPSDKNKKETKQHVNIGLIEINNVKKVLNQRESGKSKNTSTSVAQITGISNHVTEISNKTIHQNGIKNLNITSSNSGSNNILSNISNISSDLTMPIADTGVLNSGEYSTSEFLPENANSYLPILLNVKNEKQAEIKLLENKIAALQTSDLSSHRLDRIVLPPLDELRKPRKFSYLAGASMGYSSRDITINQIESKNTIKIQDISKPKESWFSQIQFHIHYNVADWLKAFTGIQIGILKQSIQVENTSKTPQKFDMVQNDSLNYSFSPTHLNSTDVRTQELIYGNIEFGLKPLISKKLNSGPFVSVVIWSAISQKSSKSNTENADFERPIEKVDLSYRLGYQHEIIKNLSAEIFMAGFPSLIASQTKGIRVNPHLIGFGICYKVR